MKDKQQFDFDIFKRVIRLAMPYKGILFFCAFLAAVLAPITVIRPYLIKVMVDKYIFTSDVDGMVYMACLIFGILLINVILRDYDHCRSFDINSCVGHYDHYQLEVDFDMFDYGSIFDLGYLYFQGKSQGKLSGSAIPDTKDECFPSGAYQWDEDRTNIQCGEATNGDIQGDQ